MVISKGALKCLLLRRFSKKKEQPELQEQQEYENPPPSIPEVEINKSLLSQREEVENQREATEDPPIVKEVESDKEQEAANDCILHNTCMMIGEIVHKHVDAKTETNSNAGETSADNDASLAPKEEAGGVMHITFMTIGERMHGILNCI